MNNEEIYIFRYKNGHLLKFKVNKSDQQRYENRKSAARKNTIKKLAEKRTGVIRTKEIKRKGPKGKLEFDDGYNKNKNKDEIEIGNWITDFFKHDVKLLKEQKGVKNPDALINGNEYWEFKNSEKGGVDSLVRKGIKQVISKGEAHIGNIVVDMKKTKLSKQKSGAEVTRRLVRDNANKKIKVVLKYDDNNVISYKRKK